jgi:hypothetical protein
MESVESDRACGVLAAGVDDGVDAWASESDAVEAGFKVLSLWVAKVIFVPAVKVEDRPAGRPSPSGRQTPR